MTYGDLDFTDLWAFLGTNPFQITVSSMFRRIPTKAVAPGATLVVVTSQAKKSERAFKAAWFTKVARKAHISDEELCAAIQRVMLGQGDDLVAEC
jgi:hypothetical protein